MALTDQSDLFIDLIRPDEFESVPTPSLEIIDSVLMSIALDKYAKHSDRIKASEVLCKKHGYFMPTKTELTGNNGEPLFKAEITQQDIDRARLISEKIDKEF